MPILEPQPRALILAIEHYPRAAGLAQELPGTVEAAKRFYTWLTTSRKIPPENIFVCCDDPWLPDLPAKNKRATTRDAIKDTVIDLMDEGRDKTSEFFFYFSGHGLGWTAQAHERPLDVLVASDFRNLEISGDRCVPLAEIQDLLERAVGGSDHYFIVDACRNVIPGASTRVTGLALAPSQHAELSDTTRYTLYSTSAGEVAAVRPDFPNALLRGLNGEGRAKDIVEGDFWVKFDRLFQYVRKQIQKRQQVDQQHLGEGEGLLYQLPAPVETECNVQVEDGDAADQFTLITKLDQLATSDTFQGPEFTKKLRPNSSGYKFEVTFNGQQICQVSPPPGKAFDLFEPATLVFKKAYQPAGALELSLGLESAIVLEPVKPQVLLTSLADPGAQIRLKNLDTGDVLTATQKFEGELDPGRWEAELWFQDRFIAKQSMDLEMGDEKTMDLAEPKPSRVLDAITSQLPADDTGKVVFMSESLGPLAERDPGLWLALIGASRILQAPDTFSKLRELPLPDFSVVQPHKSAAYVLAGLERSNSISINGTPLEPVGGLASVFQAFLPLDPGQHLLSVALPDGIPVRTYATCALPNRATFFVITEDESGAIRVQQYLLPLFHLLQFLPEQVAQLARSWFPTLKLVRLLATAQQRFSHRQTMRPVSAEDREQWDMLLYGKWLDPLVAIMAALEMIRREKDANRQILSIVLSNLQRFFPEIPDVAILAQLLGETGPPLNGVPLLKENALRMPNYTERLPLPATALDHESIWTCWRGSR